MEIELSCTNLDSLLNGLDAHRTSLGSMSIGTPPLPSISEPYLSSEKKVIEAQIVKLYNIVQNCINVSLIMRTIFL